MSATSNTFPQLTTHKLVIPVELWQKMRALVDEVDTEVMWYLLRDIDDYMDNEDPLRVDDIFVPKQAVSGGAVHMDFDDFETLNAYCRENKVFSIGNGHSHVNFGVGPSGTDLNDNITLQLTTPGMAWHENGYIVTLIMNKSGAMSARLDMRAKPEGIVALTTICAWEIGVEIEYPEADTEAIKEWAEEQKKQLRPVTYGKGYGGGYSGHGGFGWDDTMYQQDYTRPAQSKRGLDPVWYGLDPINGQTRKEMIEDDWDFIQEFLNRGWTVAYDTRTTGPMDDPKYRRALIVTDEVGNQVETLSLEVPFDGRLMKQTEETTKVVKDVIITCLADGDGVYVNPTEKAAHSYSNGNGHVELKQAVFVELDRTMQYSVHPQQTVCWDEYKDNPGDPTDDGGDLTNFVEAVRSNSRRHGCAVHQSQAFFGRQLKAIQTVSCECLAGFLLCSVRQMYQAPFFVQTNQGGSDVGQRHEVSACANRTKLADNGSN